MLDRRIREHLRSNSSPISKKTFRGYAQPKHKNLANALPLQILLGDEELEDFGGALIDAKGSDIAVKPFRDGASEQT
jgi:hypothetical protein